MKKKIILGAAGLVAVAAPIVAVPAMQADAASGTQTFKNASTGTCLDDSNRGVRVIGCHGGPNQQWRVRVWNDGTRELRNAATGNCLDYSSRYGLRGYPCNKSKFQSWFIDRWNGKIAFRNQQYGQRLEANWFSGVGVDWSSSSKTQFWS
ncbi:RICIN domain-containing protein [Luteipulveratus mongoliensis]|uniref:RICIN domain-containing protein n=1 Tax=Luteipulveratus mongoliensis TaxID=571913 RepID=UPI000697A1D9|nr:RICIN domain-containing protein [Luteipulveratus mongoliensis]